MKSSTKSAIVERLGEARTRTLTLIRPLDDEQLNRVYSPILSPLAWDLGHIANFEELWLVQTIGGREPLRGDLGRFYDAIENPRKTRGELPILRDAELRSYLADVRERTLEVLGEVEIGAGADDPLLREGFVYEMLLAHEHQHNETMLQAFQVRDDLVHPFAELWRPARAEGRKTTISLDAGEFTMGTDEVGWAYDNEQRAHVRHVNAYAIDSHPVTNAEYVRFVEAGGYAEPGLWSDAGRRWLADEGEAHPMYWRRSRGEWSRVRFGRIEPLPPEEPVQHISFHEAEAYAGWAGARLPTEAEWERAVPHISYVGQVWEWTSSSFEPYPGFKAFPYEGYSAAFFGTGLYRVLRGGSWATHGKVGRHTFRNWDLPVRRQIFAGLRLAHDIA